MNAVTRTAARMLRALTASALLAACADITPTRPIEPEAAHLAVNSDATRQHIEFEVFDSNDFPLSCLNGELTHWEGLVNVSIDVLTTPSGVVSTNFRLEFDPTYFVERANGVRYYPGKGWTVQEHHTDGPVSVIAGTAAGIFRSADGQALPLGFHVQVVTNHTGDAVVDWKFAGVCP